MTTELLITDTINQRACPCQKRPRTMRLSDAGLRRSQTKVIYLDHRTSPWLIEDRDPAIARTDR